MPISAVLKVDQPTLGLVCGIEGSFVGRSRGLIAFKVGDTTHQVERDALAIGELEIREFRGKKSLKVQHEIRRQM